MWHINIKGNLPLIFSLLRGDNSLSGDVNPEASEPKYLVDFYEVFYQIATWLN